MDNDFLQNWRQLGMAVARQTVEDYVYIMKHPGKTMEKGGIIPVSVDYLNCFLRSMYFGMICPDIDGRELAELLEDNWERIGQISVHRGWRKAVQ